MAARAKSGKGRTAKAAANSARARRPVATVLRWLRRGVLALLVALAALVVAYRFVPVPWTPYMIAERLRLGAVERDWTPMDRIAPVMARSAVAAEDANFCAHWGFDMEALRLAIDGGARRGGSTITQQVVKNVFLWHGRSWPRKALEALLTPAVELAWPKRRILEIYLNVAEFDEGVFGVQAAAWAYFGVSAEALTPTQAARLAMVLPSPKSRNAASPTAAQRRRSASILDGAATIRRDGRAACFGG